jgi:toxoflavin biosynthesis protein ToxD
VTPEPGWVGRRLGAVRLPACLVVLAACGHDRGQPPRPPGDPIRGVDYRGGEAPLSRAADAQLIAIPGGRYIAGSTPEERAVAYDDYLATAGHDGARDHGWFDREEDRHVAELPAYALDLMPVTHAQYAEFVADGGATPPSIDEDTWTRQGFAQRWPDEVVRFAWDGGVPPDERADHPVVLISYDDAAAYCRWRGLVVGADRRLPTAGEMEKAARGADGLIYPWGNVFDRDRLNSSVGGPRDTVAVGSFPAGKSPYGVLDLAGNVFQWTSTPWPPGAGREAVRRTVKGSAWDDHAGLGRGAAWHGRRRDVRHVIVGFRCAADRGDGGR